MTLAPPGIFSRLLARPALGMGAKIFFVLFPALFILLGGGWMARQDMERAIAAARLGALGQAAGDLQPEATAAQAERQLWLSVCFAVAVQMWMLILIERNQLARKRAEQVVKDSERQLLAAANAIPVLIGYLDASQRLVQANRQWQQWFGRAGPASVWRAALGPDAAAALGDLLARAHAEQPEQGELSWQDSEGHTHELAAHVVAHLDAAHAVLGHFVFLSDVTERKSLARLKAQFVATVSHELRTPLTSINGALVMLEAAPATELGERSRALVRIGLEASARLERLVSDLLLSEHIESRRLAVRLEPIDIGEVVSRAVRECQLLQDRRGVRLRQGPVPEGLRALGDADRLLQILANLLSNACKFSPAGGEVEVRVEAVGDRLRVNVLDRGPGIPPDFRDRVFERFARHDSVLKQGIEGSGLGLSIARSLAQRMGGDIDFTDRDGGGTVFHVELPLAAA